MVTPEPVFSNVAVAAVLLLVALNALPLPVLVAFRATPELVLTAATAVDALLLVVV
jgi:hypothetical protein